MSCIATRDFHAKFNKWQQVLSGIESLFGHCKCSSCGLILLQIAIIYYNDCNACDIRNSMVRVRYTITNSNSNQTSEILIVILILI